MSDKNVAQSKGGRVVRVAVRLAIDRALDYLAPNDAALQIGSLVEVPVRGKPTRGVVVAIDPTLEIERHRLKPVIQVAGALTADQIALCRFVNSYYRSPIGMAYALAIPPETVAKRELRSVPPAQSTLAPLIELNAEQFDASNAIKASLGSSHIFALLGITGSGKTEVYVAVIREVLARGGQALVLVPEINLTPQWMQRLAAQLPGAEIVALHSGLADGERDRAWRAAAQGQADVVFGTRLAVFAPLPRLALIVVDEEHDGSFKQQDTPRYHARDLAVLRGRERGVPVVLGSATPSLETYANVAKGRYRRLNLTQRAHADAVPPRVMLVSARDTRKTEGLSHALLGALAQRIDRGEQSLVFINRRGYSPILHCDLCGWKAACTDCDARMVFHSFDQKLRCHHCGAQSSAPTECPSCGNRDLLAQGGGTQRIEAFLRKRFPDARIARADADTTRGKHSWAQLYAEMAAGELDILVGTQMIAKGHDFPRLTLVGVLGADDSLYSADFRAPERLFSLLTQVAGRAGRAAAPGEVLIQTETPDHPVFMSLLAGDFDAYARRELAEREEATFPPAHALAVVRAEAIEPREGLLLLRRMQARVAQHVNVICYPPVPAPLARRATRWRWQMLVTAADRRDLHAALDAMEEEPTPEAVNVGIDVDAFDLG
jgi:primosomal protein N' (replication factor Y) (superfamily II helicase)